jgi:hypothetical protein
MKVYDEVEVEHHTFLTSKPDGGECNFQILSLNSCGGGEMPVPLEWETGWTPRKISCLSRESIWYSSVALPIIS